MQYLTRCKTVNLNLPFLVNIVNIDLSFSINNCKPLHKTYDRKCFFHLSLKTNRIDQHIEISFRIIDYHLIDILEPHRV